MKTDQIIGGFTVIFLFYIKKFLSIIIIILHHQVNIAPMGDNVDASRAGSTLDARDAIA